MIAKPILKEWLIEVLENKNGKASIVDICKFVWEKHKEELENSGDLFYTWQYDIRWAATELRRIGKMKDAHISPEGIWELTEY